MAKILIVDDDKDILRLLDFALKKAGHTPLTGATGAQGVSLAEAEQPDLIVADVMMPEMTGYEFCRQIRAHPTLSEVPVIIFSARFQPVDKQTALEAGATDYLPKTTSPAALVQRIGELLPEERAPAASDHVAIGLFSLRGGTGVTSLAINLAAALAGIRRTRPALIDLTPVGGHAALMLGLRPASSVSKLLVEANGSYSPETIKPHLAVHKAGLFLLPSALRYDQSLSLTDRRLPQLMAGLKQIFPVTVWDAPHRLEPAHAPVMRLFDKLLLVLSADMPSLQSTAVALQSLAGLGIAEERVTLVVNNLIPQGALPLPAIQKAVKRSIKANIPFDPEMIKAVNSGRPLLLTNPQSAGAAAIVRLAQSLFQGR